MENFPELNIHKHEHKTEYPQNVSCRYRKMVIKTFLLIQ